MYIPADPLKWCVSFFLSIVCKTKFSTSFTHPEAKTVFQKVKTEEFFKKSIRRHKAVTLALPWLLNRTILTIFYYHSWSFGAFILIYFGDMSNGNIPTIFCMMTPKFVNL